MENEAPKKKRGRPKGKNGSNKTVPHGRYNTPFHNDSINEFKFYNTALLKKFLSWMEKLNIEYVKLSFTEEGIRFSAYDTQTDIAVLFNISYEDNYYYYTESCEKVIELHDIATKLNGKINKDISNIDFIITDNEDVNDNFVINIPIGDIGVIPIKIQTVTEEDVELEDFILPDTESADIEFELKQKDFKSCISGAGSASNSKNRNSKVNLSIEYNSEMREIYFGLDNSTSSLSVIDKISDKDIIIRDNKDILHIVPFEKIKPMIGNNMTEKIKMYMSDSEIPLMFKLNISSKSYIHYITNAIMDDE